MLYCVHCGVSLAEDITICPLCGNAATEQGSERPAALASSALFDEEPAGIPTDLRYHRVFLGWGLSLLLLAAGIISYGIDLSRDQQITWSYYVMISLVTVWTITVLPLFHRRWSTTHLLAFTAAILGLFLIFIDARTGDLFWSLFPCSLLIALALSLLILHDRRDRPLRVTLLLLYGAFILLQSITAWLTDGNWFYSLGLPITSTVWLLISAFIFVVKTRSASQQPPPGRYLYTLLICLSICITAVVTELCIARHLMQELRLSWSVYVMIGTSPLAAVALAAHLIRPVQHFIQKKFRI